MNLVLVKSYLISSTAVFRHYYLLVIKFDCGMELERYEYHPGMKVKKTTVDFYNPGGSSRVERVMYLCDECTFLVEEECNRKFRMAFRNCDVFAGTGFQTIMLTSVLVFSVLGFCGGVGYQVNWVIALLALLLLVVVNRRSCTDVRELKCPHLNGTDGVAESAKTRDIRDYLRVKHMLGL